MLRSLSVRLAVFLVCAASLVLASSGRLHAQGFEPLGARAEGMGGAFVGVADDATATYWNPAGLASIPLFDLSVAFGRLDQSGGDEPGGGIRPAWRTRNSGFAIALPVLGVSYYRLRTSRAQPAPTALDTILRDDANTTVAGEVTSTWNLGVTLVQSVGDAVVVGSTLRLVRAGATISTFSADGLGPALDRAADLDVRGETKFDADLGVMAYVGRARLGLTVRNLVAPTWDAGSLPLESDRLVRVGIGVGPDPTRGRRAWSVAADADLTTARGLDGDRRAVAIGAEHWFRKGRVAVRGGARAQTVGDVRPVATGGASLGIRSGFLLEGQVTAGGDTVERGWGLGARVTF